MRLKPLILLALVCGLAPVALTKDVTVKLSDAPAAVQRIVQAQVADGTMGDITKDADDEETVFDVDLTAKDGSDRDFSVAQDGTLLSTEVNLNETPDDAQKAIQSELAGGTLDSIDKNLADFNLSFDVEGTGKDGKDKNFTVADDGTILSREITLSEAPEAVQKTINEKLEGGKVTSINENFDDDGTNFDVSVTASDDLKKSFNVLADGTFASERVPLVDVPPRARATIKDHIGDGTVLRVDKSFVKERGVDPYDVEGRKDGKPFDFSVGPRGKFLGMDQ
jgi:uncharacterized membrane protein YkoI